MNLTGKINQVLEIMQNTQNPNHPGFNNAVNQYESMIADTLAPLLLIEILCDSTNKIDPKFRQLAGLWFKRSIIIAWPNSALVDSAHINRLKTLLFSNLGHPDSRIRSSVSISIISLLSHCSLSFWPDLPFRLTKILNTHARSSQPRDIVLCEGCLTTLRYICTDCSVELISSPLDPHPLSEILPTLNRLVGIKYYTLKSLQSWFPFLTESRKPIEFTTNYLNPFLDVLFDTFLKVQSSSGQNQPIFLLQTTPKDIQIVLMTILYTLSDVWMHVIHAKLDLVFQLMYLQLFSTHEMIIRVAVDFWCNIGEEWGDILKSSVNKTQTIDILSRFQQLCRMGSSDLECFGIQPNGNVIQAEKPFRSTLGIQSQSQLGESYFNFHSAPTSLREMASWAITSFVLVHGPVIITPMMDILNKQLISNDWKDNEAALMSIGTLASSCFDGLLPHLPKIYPKIFELASYSTGDTLIHPCLLFIAFWVLSQLSMYVFLDLKMSDSDASFKTASLKIVALKELYISSLKHPNFQVRSMVCTGLSSFLDCADADGIGAVFDQVFNASGDILYEWPIPFHGCVYEIFVSLWKRAPPELSSNPSHVQSLFNLLERDWNQISNSDLEICDLFHCLKTISICSQTSIHPYSSKLISRAYEILRSVEAETLNALKAREEPPDKRFILYPLHLIEGIVDALGPSALEVSLSSKGNDLATRSAQTSVNKSFYDPFRAIFPDFLASLINHTSGYGDITKLTLSILGSFFAYFPPNTFNCEFASTCINISFKTLNIYFQKVIPNSLWLLENAAIRFPDALRKCVDQINEGTANIDRVLSLFHIQNTQTGISLEDCKSIHQAVTCAVGYLGHCIPEQLAIHLHEYLEIFINVGLTMDPSKELDTAIQGIKKVCEAYAKVKGEPVIFQRLQELDIKQQQI